MSAPRRFEIEDRVVRLVDALNRVPGVETFSSCGGHENPSDIQAPADGFKVSFGVPRTWRGWRALDLITEAAFAAWAATCVDGPVEGEPIEPTYTVVAWSNGEPGSGSTDFEIHGRNGADPDVLAEAIEGAL